MHFPTHKVILNNTKKIDFLKFLIFFSWKNIFSKNFNFFRKKLIFCTFQMILSRFEQKNVFSIFWNFSMSRTRYPRLWLILEATPDVQSIYPLSCTIYTYRSTTLPNNLVIALLVWLQWWSKFADILQKHDFCDLRPYLGVAPMGNFWNFNF